MRREFVGELHNSKEIDTKHISRDKNLADNLTHCQPSGPFNRGLQQVANKYKECGGYRDKGGPILTACIAGSYGNY